LSDIAFHILIFTSFPYQNKGWESIYLEVESSALCFIYIIWCYWLMWSFVAAVTMSKKCAKCEKTVYPTEELKCLDKVGGFWIMASVVCCSKPLTMFRCYTRFWICILTYDDFWLFCVWVFLCFVDKSIEKRPVAVYSYYYCWKMGGTSLSISCFGN
jgi:hypothetical protein